MCDFLDFGLTIFSIMCIQVVARLPQRLKSTFFEIFPYSAGSFGATPFKKCQKTLILAFEANGALSCENETKIVKITHSVEEGEAINNVYVANRAMKLAFSLIASSILPAGFSLLG